MIKYTSISKLMKFYHVSKWKEEPKGVFKPRVPDLTMISEDKETKRICLSNTLVGCINAVDWVGELSEDGNMLTGNSLYSKPIIVYEFEQSDILEGNLLDPSYLVENNLVKDAYTTNEFWVVNQDLVPCNIYGMVIKCPEYNETDQQIDYMEEDEKEEELSRHIYFDKINIIEFKCSSVMRIKEGMKLIISEDDVKVVVEVTDAESIDDALSNLTNYFDYEEDGCGYLVKFKYEFPKEEDYKNFMYWPLLD